MIQTRRSVTIQYNMIPILNDHYIRDSLQAKNINCVYKRSGRVNTYEGTSNNKIACFMAKQYHNCVGYASVKYKSVEAEYYAFTYANGETSLHKVLEMPSIL